MHNQGELEYLNIKMTYLSVRAVGAKLVEDEGVKEAHVSSHLLHASQLSLFLSVGVLYH